MEIYWLMVSEALIQSLVCERDHAAAGFWHFGRCHRGFIGLIRGSQRKQRRAQVDQLPTETREPVIVSHASKDSAIW